MSQSRLVLWEKGKWLLFHDLGSRAVIKGDDVEAGGEVVEPS